MHRRQGLLTGEQAPQSEPLGHPDQQGTEQLCSRHQHLRQGQRRRWTYRREERGRHGYGSGREITKRVVVSEGYHDVLLQV